MGQEPDIERLRDAARRLAAELDEARLYRVAAYASMAGDAIVRRQAQDDRSELQAEDERPDSPPGAGETATGAELEFEADEHGRVWMIRAGDCHIIGRAGSVRAEMRRFLAGVAPGDDRPDPE